MVESRRPDLGRFGSIGKVLSGLLLSAKFITVSLPAVGPSTECSSKRFFVLLQWVPAK
jgi:hypothetical protein